MICPNCGASVLDVPFLRMSPKGQHGIWWCEACVEETEPELYKNLKEEESELEKQLKKDTYGDKKRILAFYFGGKPVFKGSKEWHLHKRAAKVGLVGNASLIEATRKMIKDINNKLK